MDSGPPALHTLLPCLRLPSLSILTQLYLLFCSLFSFPSRFPFAWVLKGGTAWFLIAGQSAAFREIKRTYFARMPSSW